MEATRLGRQRERTDAGEMLCVYVYVCVRTCVRQCYDAGEMLCVYVYVCVRTCVRQC